MRDRIEAVTRDEGMIRWEKSELVARAGWRDYVKACWALGSVGLGLFLLYVLGWFFSGGTGFRWEILVALGASMLGHMRLFSWGAPGMVALRRVYGEEFSYGRGVWSGRDNPFYHEAMAVRIGEEGIYLFTKGLQTVIRPEAGLDARVQKVRGASYLILNVGGKPFKVMARDQGKLVAMAEGTSWIYRSERRGGGVADEDAQLRELERQGFFRKGDRDG